MKVKRLSSILILSTALSLTGCGEFSYKRGAGPTDFQAEKESCSNKGSSADQVNACLAENGWLVVSKDKPLFVDVTATDAKPFSTDQADYKSTAAKKEVKPLDPLDKVEVGSWWKTGASPQQLQSDSDQCVAKLGDAHKAENNMSLVTVGLVLCMKEKGWYVLKK